MKFKVLFVIMAFLGTTSKGYVVEGHEDILADLKIVVQDSENEGHLTIENKHDAEEDALYSIATTVLAPEATDSLASGQAANEGKHALLQDLEKQRASSHHVLHDELEQLQSAELTAAASSKAAHQASKHVAILKGALANAQSLAQQADDAAARAAQDSASHSSLVIQTKAKLEEIEHKLEDIRTNVDGPKESAQLPFEFDEKHHPAANLHVTADEENITHGDLHGEEILH